MSEVPVQGPERLRGGPQQTPTPDGTVPGPRGWWQEPGAPQPQRIGLETLRKPFADPPPAWMVIPESGRLTLPGGRMAAAVLCALFEDSQGEAAVLLTRRSSRLRSHTGEVSFPGGRIEPGESALHAALRETHEEVGIDPDSVEIIGQLSPIATVSSRSAITPFVGVLPGPPELRPNPEEVDRAFAVTLRELLDPAAYREEIWPINGGTTVYFFELWGDTVWGATARMLRELIGICLPDPTAEDHKP